MKIQSDKLGQKVVYFYKYTQNPLIEKLLYARMTFGFYCRIITKKLPNENPIVTQKKIIYSKKRIGATL